MDPSNPRVREGMERVEKHGDMGMDSTYDVEVDDNTDNEVASEITCSSSESAQMSAVKLNNSFVMEDLQDLDGLELLPTGSS